MKQHIQINQRSFSSYVVTLGGKLSRQSRHVADVMQDNGSTNSPNWRESWILVRQQGERRQTARMKCFEESCGRYRAIQQNK
jgi:hypothetical protein